MIHTPPDTPVPPPATASLGAADGACADRTAARVERHRRMLQELGEIGMDMARLLHWQAQALASLQDIAEQAGVTEVTGAGVTLSIRGDLGLAFSRLTRAVRLTMALEARLDEDEQARLDRLAREDAARRAEQAAAEAKARTEHLAGRKKAVERMVLEAIDAEAASDEAFESLSGDLYERLLDEEDYGDYAERPIAETVARLCRDLGLSPDWTRLAEDAWAADDLSPDDLSAAGLGVGREDEGLDSPADTPPSSPPKTGPPPD